MELNTPAIINSCVGIMLLKNLTLTRDTEINLTLTRAAALANDKGQRLNSLQK